MTHEPCDLVLVTFGPIQSFIAASRRTQDLAVSSQILSSLAYAGLKYIDSHPDLDAVFPVLGTGEGWEKRLPNRLVFLAPHGQGRNSARAVLQEVQGQWGRIGNSVKSFLSKKTAQAEWHDDWDRQIEEWLETYWVSVHWDGQDSTYKEAFQTLNLAIDARKSVRAFPITPQPGEKGSLVGTLSALGVDKYKNINIWEEIGQKVGQTQLKENEKLSAIGAVKRFADQAGAHGIKLERFPSTSSIAVSSFKQQILENWGATASLVERFITAINALGLMTFAEPEPFPKLKALAGNEKPKNDILRLEGDYFFREFYSLEKVNENRKNNLPKLAEGYESNNLIKKASAALSELLDKLIELSKDFPIPDPTPNAYFASLAMDGDHMGHLIDGAGSLEAHKSISRTMSTTANEIREIVEDEFSGVLIYSGGDDVLALLPVNCVLEVAEKVRGKFRENMKSIGKEVDMSGGIAIMHHQAPLEAILQKARAAEHKAKEEYGRSVLVLSIVKRSGEDLSCAMKWRQPFENTSIEQPSPINNLIDYFSEGCISTKIVYDLRNEANTFRTNRKVLEWEMKRLMNRHLILNPEDRIDPNRFAEQLVGFIGQLPPQEDEVAQLINWILAARFIAKGERS